MPRNFTPAPREAVVEKAKDIDSVDTVAKIGPAVAICYDMHETDPHIYTALMEDFGWYVASFEKDSCGDVAILAPVTEVP